MVKGFHIMNRVFVIVAEQGWRLEMMNPAIFYPPQMGSFSGQTLALLLCNPPDLEHGAQGKNSRKLVQFS